MHEVTALLPMKGHSERVPGKNMKDFCGRPLYHRVMEALLGSRHVREVVIDTDSDEIADDALRNFPRVRIVVRPEEIRGDFVEMNAVIAHDMSRSQGEHFLQTHSTNPLLTTATVDRAVEAYFDGSGRYDSLFSVTRLQTRLYDRGGRAINHDPAVLMRTQDLPPVYEENSNLYVFSRRSFAGAGGKRIGLRPMMLEMDRLEASDIDEPEEFILAEALFRMRMGGMSNPREMETDKSTGRHDA